MHSRELLWKCAFKVGPGYRSFPNRQSTHSRARLSHALLPDFKSFAGEHFSAKKNICQGFEVRLLIGSSSLRENTNTKPGRQSQDVFWALYFLWPLMSKLPCSSRGALVQSIHMTRLDNFHNLQHHAWFKKVYCRLGKRDIWLATEFIRANDSLDAGKFEMAINRMFLDREKPKAWKCIIELLCAANVG